MKESQVKWALQEPNQPLQSVNEFFRTLTD